VHSKLRNGAKGRRGAAVSPAPPTVPTFPRPDTNNKRKGRPVEPDEAAGKRSRSGSRGPTASPPTSPVLLECPEPNCSKKYKHINGLKYHQSHAHGSVEEEVDSKDAISLSENDESNAEPPTVPLSPSPEKAVRPEVKVEPASETWTPSPSATPEAEKQAAKGIMRFSEEPVAPSMHFNALVKPAPIATPAAAPPAPSVQPPPPPPVLNVPTVPKSTPPPAKPAEVKLADNFKVKIPSPMQRPVSASLQLKVVQPLPVIAKVDAKDKPSPQPQLHKPSPTPPPPAGNTTPKKKQPRKSPATSPQPEQQNGVGVYAGGAAPTSPLAITQPVNEGREEVQSPAYSDISDDGAPIESEENTPLALGEKKLDGQAPFGPYGMYSYYGQTPYLPANAPPVAADNGSKEEKDLSKSDKEKKEDFPQKQSGNVPQQAPPHYYPYAYYPYNLEAPPFPLSVISDKYIDENEVKVKEEKRDKDAPKVLQGTPPTKTIKLEAKEKQNENHQILKESIEMKSQMGDKKFYDYPYHLYQRQQEELRRYQLYPPDKRKDMLPQPLDATMSKETPPKSKPPSKSSYPDTEKGEKKDQDKGKQEGVKPTMETQGPPPPTNSYAYFNPNYIQSPHYGTLPFDPNHPMYRGINPMLVPGPYGANPYLHPQMRYPGPEDLSRGPPTGASTKALDMLQHHASQYAYSSHKIHELQERALKSPNSTPGAKNPVMGSNVSNPLPPSSSGPPPPAPGVILSSNPLPGTSGGSPRPPSGGTLPPAGVPPPTGKTASPAPPPDKDGPPPMRSPPPQRHVHTHHHTHVGLGYPILPGQYPAPYGGKDHLVNIQIF
jgi:hypothetical protein